MSKEVLQEALELLAVATFYTLKLQDKRTDVIKAGLQALGQPAPVAKPHEQEPSYWLGYGLQAHTEKPFESATPVWTSPQPAQRTWVGLTDESIVHMMPKPVLLSANVERWDRAGLLAFARAIEATLRQKNT